MNLALMFERAVDRYPEAEAVSEGGERLNYGEWSRRIASVTRGLYETGIRPGDRFGIISRNTGAVATLICALHRLGAVPVPLSFRWRSSDLAHAIVDAALAGLAYGDGARVEVDRALRDLSGSSLCRVRVGLSGGSPDGLVPYADLGSCPPIDPEGITYRSNDWSVILYTSGTTGRPKGVIRTHESDYMATLGMVLEHRWSRFERVLWAMPPHHTMGLHTLFGVVLLNGMLIPLPRFEPDTVLDLIGRSEVTALYLVPTAFHDLVRQAESRGLRLPPVSKLASAGAPIQPALVRSCLEVFRPDVFVNHYGCTEMNMISANHDLGSKPDSAGRPAIHSRIRLVVAERERKVGPHEVVARGDTGEVIVDMRSPQAFYGYLNRPEAMENAVREGWYFTGDVGYIDGDGDLRLAGRVDDMIISGGENIHPSEVEGVIRGHPLVRDVAVTGVPHERWGETVAAFIVPASPDLTAREIERFCLDSPELAPFKRPRHIFFVDAIPRSPAGKVLRRLLRRKTIYKRKV